MISEHEALTRVLADLPVTAVETIPLAAVCGRICADEVRAYLALPGFDNSAMDGWAIHAADCGKESISLRITGEQPAGVGRGLTLRAGEAVRIFTGAPLPTGTGAVVMQEDAEPQGGSVLIREAARNGEFIRRAGSDLCAGQLIAAKGTRITPVHMGLIASQGIESLPCHELPRAAVICTGGELTAAGQSLPHAGALYNSNGPMLSALVASTLTALPVAQDLLPDDMDIITATLRKRLEECDVLILAAGVSVGDHDLVRPALDRLGIRPDFWRVSVKPGKPFLFCRHGHRVIFGLPGNPVSAYVTALLFVLPALRRMAGAAVTANATTAARAVQPLLNKSDRAHYLRGRFDHGAGTFTPAGLQESHALAGLSMANALARLEPGEEIAECGMVPLVLMP